VFNYVLSDDKTRLKLVTTTGETELSAAEVARLSVWFANLRNDMSPEVADSALNDPVTISCDRYEALTDALDGSAKVAMRIPGFGWAFVHLAREQCQSLAELLHPQPPPTDSTIQ
jgi:hypothetical protein